MLHYGPGPESCGLFKTGLPLRVLQSQLPGISHAFKLKAETRRTITIEPAQRDAKHSQHTKTTLLRAGAKSGLWM